MTDKSLRPAYEDGDPAAIAADILDRLARIEVRLARVEAAIFTNVDDGDAAQ
jgi:hypothetical protein